MPEMIDHYKELTEKYDIDYNSSSLPAVVESGSGACLYDYDGNSIIDLSDIIAIVGHSHPLQVEAIKKAAGSIIAEKGVTNKYKAELLEKLVQMTPGDLNKVFLATSGSEITEWAVRIARKYSKSHEILSFWGGVYGRTYGAMSMNGLARRKDRFGPLVPGSIYAPYPNCYRCPFEKEYPECDFFCIKFLDRIIKAESTNDVAGLIIEPYLGVGGIIFPPEGYLTRLKNWAEERDIIFILDEIQSSFGRTGRKFALEWEDLTPDFLCLGKGLGGGISIAALLTGQKYINALNAGDLSGGSGGNPLACASALTVIDIIERENLAEHSRKMGKMMFKALKKFKNRFQVIGDVRGRGLTLGIEFVKDREKKEPLTEIVPELIKTCYKNGIYISGSQNIISIRPPLVITEEQIDKALFILEKSLEEVLNR